MGAAMIDPVPINSVKANRMADTNLACRRSVTSVIVATGSNSHCPKLRLPGLEWSVEEEEKI